MSNILALEPVCSPRATVDIVPIVPAKHNTVQSGTVLTSNRNEAQHCQLTKGRLVLRALGTEGGRASCSSFYVLP